jgi:transmembrane sensor
MTERSLPTPIKQLLLARQPEERLQRIWHGIAARRSRPRSRIVVGYALAAACAALLVVLGLWSHLGRSTAQPSASQLALPSSIVGTTDQHTQSFGFGAAVTVAKGTRLDVLNQSPKEMLLALRHGVARFDIRPGGPRRWQIECGGTTVEVVGTEFVVERDPRVLRVAVSRGKVLVRGERVPDAVQALDAGRELTIRYESQPNAVSGPEVASESASVEPPRSLKPAAGADWRSAARRSEWQHAWQLLGADGLAREASRSDDVVDLLALADVARLSGHPEQATAPLRQIVQGHASDSRAAIAAFSLGKILLVQLGRAAEAASAFESAIALQLPASLVEDAEARLVEAYARAGDPQRARNAASIYRARFPAGRRAAEVQRWSPAE